MAAIYRHATKRNTDTISRIPMVARLIGTSTASAGRRQAAPASQPLSCLFPDLPHAVATGRRMVSVPVSLSQKGADPLISTQFFPNRK